MIATSVTNAEIPFIASMRPVAIWLFVCCAMVFVMVILGGITRLTESGLSMVEWRPLIGVIPPLNESDWEDVFAKYRRSPEFQKLNFWMGLAEFKVIFWMEYAHRVWGRAIGVVFSVPLLYFLVRRRLDRRLTAHLFVLLFLGGLQGVFGWYMVKSGLVDQADVSQVRLAGHLGLAFLIYGYMLWLALGLVLRPGPPIAESDRFRLWRFGWAMMAWLILTVLSGALVAGLDAGVVYNTFPLMDGRLVPAEMFAIQPWPYNFFENAATVQFDHRVLAVTLACIAVAFWWRARAAAPIGRLRWALALIAAAALGQALLGIVTLIGHAVITLAAAHQTGSLILFSLVIWTLFELRQPNLAPAASALSV